MIKKIAVIIVLSGISFAAFCQETNQPAPTQPENAKPLNLKPADPSTVRPDIPGIFTLEFGFNQDMSGPTDFSLGFFGSRTVNVYYQYELRLFKSPISIVPGIGFSFERYRFKNNYVMGYTNTTSDQVTLIAPGTGAPYPNVRKSLLVTNYLDVPVEIRYTMKPDDPTRSFKIAVGGRIGYLFDPFSKVKYKEDSEVKKIKDKQDFNLTRIRYGLTGRIGFGNFALFGYYNLTPLFEKGKGLQTNDESNDFSTMTIGISLSSF